MTSSKAPMDTLRDVLIHQVRMASEKLLLDPAPNPRIKAQTLVLDQLLDLIPEVAKACRDERGVPYAMEDLGRDEKEHYRQAQHYVTMLSKIHGGGTP